MTDTFDQAIGSLIRDAFERGHNRMIMISKVYDGSGYQVSMKNPSGDGLGDAFTVELDRDVIKAIWKCLVPFHERRLPPNEDLRPPHDPVRMQRERENPGKDWNTILQDEYLEGIMRHGVHHDLFGPVNEQNP